MNVNRIELSDRSRAALSLVVMLTVIVSVSLGLTAISAQRWSRDCRAQDGVIETTTWLGLPVESMCHYGRTS